jgi:hypothetical protein
MKRWVTVIALAVAVVTEVRLPTWTSTSAV